MSQQMSVSDDLALAAYRQAHAAGISAEQQLELWASIGLAIEPILGAWQAGEGATNQLRQRFATVDSPTGRKRVFDYLDSGPFPRFKADPDRPGTFVRTDANGTQSLCRFVDGRLEDVP